MNFKDYCAQKLSRQFLFPVIAFLISMFGILIIISSVYARKMVYQSETNTALERTKEINEIITQLIEETQTLAKITSQNIHVQNGYKSGNKDELQKFVNSQVKLEDFYEAVFLTDSQGKLIAHPNESSIGMDISSFQAWKAIAEDGQESYIDKKPVLSPITQNPIVIIGHKITDENNNFLGIAGYTVDLFKFAEIFINQYKIAGTGYFFAVDSENRAIIHPKKEMILNEKMALIDFNSMAKDDYGIIKYVHQGTKKTLSYTKIKDLEWLIMGSMYDKDLKKVGSVISNIILITSIIILILLAIIITYLLNQKISVPIKRVLVGLDLISKNDFTLKAKDDLLTRQDEIGLLANSYEKTRTQVASALQNVIKGIKTLNDKSKILEHTAESLVNNSTNMNSQSQMVSASSEQISSNANVIASSAEEASVSVSTVAAATEQLSSNISQVASAAEQTSASVKSTVNEINNLSNNINNAGNSVSALVGEINGIVSAIEEMNTTISEIAKNTQNASDISIKASKEAEMANMVMVEMQKTSNEIGKIVKLINDIADQTNMLALNATIEAASAGDAGKGFAVVANEVKSLAKQTAEATANIANQINDVQKSVQNSTSSLSNITQIIDKLNEINTVIASSIEEQNITTREIAHSSGRMGSTANDVLSQISTVVDYSKKITNNANEATLAVNEISKNSNESAKASGEIANSSEQANIGVQEITKNTVEVSQGIQEVARNISDMLVSIEQTAKDAENTEKASVDLSNLAEELTRMVEQFKL